MALVKGSKYSSGLKKKLLIILVILGLVLISSGLYYLKQKGVWIFQEAGRVQYLGPPQKVIQKEVRVSRSQEDASVSHNCTVDFKDHELYIGECNGDNAPRVYLGGYIIFKGVPVEALLTLSNAELVMTLDGTYRGSTIDVEFWAKEVDSSTLSQLYAELKKSKDVSNFFSTLDQFKFQKPQNSNYISTWVIPGSEQWQVGQDKSIDITNALLAVAQRYRARYRGCLESGEGKKCPVLPKINILVRYQTIKVDLEEDGAPSHRRFFAFDRQEERAPRLRLSYERVVSPDIGQSPSGGDLPPVGQTTLVKNPAHKCLNRKIRDSYGSMVVAVGSGSKRLTVNDIFSELYQKYLAAQHHTQISNVRLNGDFEYYVLPTPCDVEKCFGNKKKDFAEVCIQKTVIVGRYKGRIDIVVDGGSAGRCTKTMDVDDVVSRGGMVYHLKRPRVLSYVCGSGKPIQYIGPPEQNGGVESGRSGQINVTAVPLPTPTSSGVHSNSNNDVQPSATSVPGSGSSSGGGASYTVTPTPETSPSRDGSTADSSLDNGAGGSTISGNNQASGYYSASNGERGDSTSTNHSSSSNATLSGSGGVKIAWRRKQDYNKTDALAKLPDEGYNTSVNRGDGTVALDTAAYPDTAKYEYGQVYSAQAGRVELYDNNQSKAVLIGLVVGTATLSLVGVLWWGVRSGLFR